MSVDLEKLPADIDELKSIIEKQSGEIARLREQNSLLKRDLYGKRSEKRKIEDEQQERLFNEAEAYAPNSIYSAGLCRVSNFFYDCLRLFWPAHV